MGSPGSGKTTMAALIFADLKMRGHLSELVQEYVKHLVWKGDIETIMNQYFVSKKQYELFKNVNGKVDFIVTDGSLIHGLYYNQSHAGNVSNVEKTDKKIKEYINEFENVFVFLERGSWQYEKEGRIHTEEQSVVISNELKKLLNDLNVPYKCFASNKDSLSSIIDYVLGF